MSESKTILITGANSGIGKAMAIQLSAAGHRVVMGCRSQERGEAAKAEIEKTAKAPVALHLVDVGKPDSIRAFAAEIANNYEHIDVLMNNAGVYLPKREVVPPGVERMFAINHLGPFLLTHLLLDQLQGSRVVTTSSMGHRFTNFDMDNLQSEKRFLAIQQYGLTKLANILFTRELAARGGAHGILAHCFHPGAVATEFAQDDKSSLLGLGVKVAKVLLRSPEKAAETGVYLALDPAAERVNGEYWSDLKVRKTTRAARSKENAVALWERSAELLGMQGEALAAV